MVSLFAGCGYVGRQVALRGSLRAGLPSALFRRGGSATGCPGAGQQVEASGLDLLALDVEAAGLELAREGVAVVALRPGDGGDLDEVDEVYDRDVSANCLP